MTSFTDHTAYMSFHDRWPHITHMRWLCQQASGICSSHLRMLREKSYYKGPVFLWTSVVPLSPLLSILMPTSNCENPSCFRRKSILCGDPLPFSCIMFFAMKGSYKPKNVFGVFFFLWQTPSVLHVQRSTTWLWWSPSTYPVEIHQV